MTGLLEEDRDVEIAMKITTHAGFCAKKKPPILDGFVVQT